MIILIFTIGLLISLVAALILDGLFFRKFHLLWRIIFMYVLLTSPLLLMFGIQTILYETPTWHEFLGFVLLLLILGVLAVIGIYVSSIPGRRRIRKLKTEYAQLPEGPQKEKLGKLLSRIKGGKGKDGNDI